MSSPRKLNPGHSKFLLRAKSSALALCACGFGLTQTAHAATAQVNGEAAVVGEFISNTPPTGSELKGLRVPLGLRLEGRASNSVSVFLDLRYNANNYPNVAFPLGNMEGTSEGLKATGNDVNHPFTRNGGRGEKRELLKVNQAYVEYMADVGRFQAGRIPRHWGLGVWLDDTWKPEGGSISTSDAISYAVDFSTRLWATAYWEKISEGSLSSRSDDADALTGEILLSDDMTDGGATGVSRKLGIAFSKYDHSDSSTELKILDIFGEFAFGRLGLGAELNWPTGKTSSFNFDSLGGESAVANGPTYSRESQTVEGLNILVRAGYQLGGGAAPGDMTSKISQTEAARRRRPTSQVAGSQIINLLGGFSRGDADAFANVKTKDSRITGVPMHPNVRPAFLMFNPLSQDIAGMPGTLVRNVVFGKAEYSYESPTFGMIAPAVVFARLDQTNSKTTDGTASVGGNGNLGFEVDLTYSYRTMDGVRFSLDGGLWVPGGAWETSGVKPETVYGLRATAATYF
ncbi:MAG: hypothetical protein ACO3A4_10270 [Silvanigrellaceae bacterium]